MAGRRIVYGAVLALALLFQIFYKGYLARILLLAAVILPVLSLLLAVPCAACLRLRLDASRPELRRGEAGQWRLTVENPVGLPLARLSLELVFQNQLTGWETAAPIRYSGGARGCVCVLSIDADHCGRMLCFGKRARLLDYLGLFSLPVRGPVPAGVLVLPVPEETALPELDGPVRRPGGENALPGGDYDLRDYRPGDPLRAVHWKLSSKRGRLVVREWTRDPRPQIVLELDWYGPPDRLDRLLDRLSFVSAALVGLGCPHAVRWPEGGERRSARVAGGQDWADVLSGLLSRRAPLTGEAAPDAPAPEGALCFLISDEEV